MPAGPVRRLGYQGTRVRQLSPDIVTDNQPLGSDRLPHLDQPIPTGSITNDKLAPNSVTSDKILDGTIVAADIAPGTIESFDRDPGFGETSGALPAVTFVSGTGRQIDTASDRFLVVPITVGAPTSTLAEALSPDNVTYTTLVTNSYPDPGGGASFANIVYAVRLFVPKAWWVRLTAVTSTIGTGHYY